MLCATLAPGSPPAARGQESPAAPERIVVTGRADSLIGIAGSAAEGTVGQEQLAQRPILRPGEVLESIPGVIVTQHAGGGKANQFFLRGFNLDHGTDFATTVGGLPINLPSHAHGQGYTDLNFLIPELIERVDYQKGPYTAANGDFASAGAAQLSYFDRLPANLLVTTGGNYGYGRALLAISHTFGSSDGDHAPDGKDAKGNGRVGLFDNTVTRETLDDLSRGERAAAPPSAGDRNPGTLLAAVELFHADGPWDSPDDFQKVNAVVRYSQSHGPNGWSLTVSSYAGRWNGTQQIARRAEKRGIVGPFGTLDGTDGGDSHRAILAGEWHASLTENFLTRVTLYTSYYDLDLFSNFTYFLDDPVRGDQFEQLDQRQVSGLALEHRIFSRLWDHEVTTAFGFQARNDFVFRSQLARAERRNVYATILDDRNLITTLSPWVDNRVQWTPWLRSVVGLRGDQQFYDVRSDTRANSGHDDAFILSPKGQLVFGPWWDTEFYLDGGFGFHSNDARGVVGRLDPGTGDPQPTVAGLVRQRGAEVGARTTWVPHLQSTFGLWFLQSDQELVFAGDTGNNEATRASRRYGVEIANYYTPFPWLTVDADYALSNARYTELDPAGNRVPETIQAVLNAGVSVHDLRGFDFGLRVRYFGPRDLIEDGSVKSKASTLLYARAGYRFNQTWSVDVDVFNLLNSRVNDQEYYYASRLRGELAGPDDGGYNDRHIHPAEARSVRATLSARF